MNEPFTKDELINWGYALERFLDVLNGEYKLGEAVEDLLSLREEK